MKSFQAGSVSSTEESGKQHLHLVTRSYSDSRPETINHINIHTSRSFQQCGGRRLPGL